jgi:hypothetical protein
MTGCTTHVEGATMDEFFGFVISFFREWSRFAGLWTLVLAGATSMQWIKMMYIPQGLQDIDDFVIGGSVAIMAVCSVVFFLMKPEATPKTPAMSGGPAKRA